MGGTQEPGTHIEVVCHAGHKGDERPIRFRLGEADYFVEEVVHQWSEPEASYFKVTVSGDDGVYVLRRSTGPPEGEWTLDAHRSGS